MLCSHNTRRGTLHTKREKERRGSSKERVTGSLYGMWFLSCKQENKVLLVSTPRRKTGLFSQITPSENADQEKLKICSTAQVSYTRLMGRPRGMFSPGISFPFPFTNTLTVKYIYVQQVNYVLIMVVIYWLIELM